MSRVVLVTGPPRAGFDTVGSLLAACRVRRHGVLSAAVTPETPSVWERLVRPELLRMGADVRCQKPLPSRHRVAEVAKVKARLWARDFLAHCDRDVQGYRPRIYACPSSVLLWPLWHAAFPEARWVLVERPEAELVRACLATGWMSAYSRPQDWERWAREYAAAGRELEAVAPVSRLELRPILDGDLRELRATAEWCSLEWRERWVLDALESRRKAHDGATGGDGAKQNHRGKGPRADRVVR